MKILLIGDAYHHHTQNFARWMNIIDLKNHIDIINLSEKRGAINENPFENIFNAYPKFLFRFKGFVRLFGIFFFKKTINSFKGKYDITNIHYVKPNYVKILDNLRQKTNHLILTYWGSDFYCCSDKNKKKLKSLITHSDAIIADNPELVTELNTYYKNISEKTYFCFFGCAPLEKIKKLKDDNISSNQSKEYLKLPSEKTTIMLGHNGSSSHQHLEIIQILENSSLIEIKDQIHFLLPITYGGNKEYIKILIARAKESPFEFSIFDFFMTDEDTSQLRNATDIMINLQKTDALSGTMKEILYAGNIVINGKWLPYNILKENNIYYHEILNLLCLPEKLIFCIKNLNTEKEKSKYNEIWAYQSASWKVNIKKWYSVYLKVNREEISHDNN